MCGLKSKVCSVIGRLLFVVLDLAVGFRGVSQQAPW